jgi:hypothetical protein
MIRAVIFVSAASRRASLKMIEHPVAFERKALAE